MLALPKLARAPDDDALSHVIAVGIPGTEMPGTRMTADENRQLVIYVRNLGRAQPGEFRATAPMENACFGPRQIAGSATPWGLAAGALGRI